MEENKAMERTEDVVEKMEVKVRKKPKTKREIIKAPTGVLAKSLAYNVFVVPAKKAYRFGMDHKGAIIGGAGAAVLAIYGGDKLKKKCMSYVTNKFDDKPNDFIVDYGPDDYEVEGYDETEEETTVTDEVVNEVMEDENK